MAEAKSFDEVLHQISQFFNGLSGRQLTLLTGGAVVIAGTLWAFVHLLGQPHYTLLYSGLRPEEAQNLAQRLAARSIAYQIGPDGASLLVPAEQVDTARVETAAQGLPRSARMGFDLFDTPNWAGSDFTEKVNYQRALEGELERTLRTLSEIEAVRVHVVLPEASLFTDKERQPKAAVIVKTRSGRLSERAQAAIPQLVAAAVDQLRPENVTVVDADSNSPMGPPSGPNLGGLSLDQQLAASIVQTLEPVLGADHARASVHVEYDTSSSEDTQEVFDPKATTPLSTQHTEESSGNVANGGLPGTASNVPGAQPGVAAVPSNGADGEHQSSKSESATYAVSKTVRHTIQPAGRLKRITAAVLVDDAMEWQEHDGKKTSTHRKRTPEEMKEIEQLARAAIGADTTRGDLLAIENIAFRELPAEKPVAADRFEKWRHLLGQWAGALRYAGLAILFLIVYGLILRPIKKQALEAFRQIPSRLTVAVKPVVAGGAAIDLGTGTEDSRRAAELRKQLTEKVRAEPAVATRLVQSWMKDGEKR